MSLPAFVAPGHLISSDEGFMRGHGTMLVNQKNLHSTVAGSVEKINKLICVNPLKCRYLGDIGDVVIGRIVEVGQKRWKVDIGGRQDASLLLSAITLPGGIQRRKQESDQLQMRTFFNEGEIICAEVQQIYQDGSVSIHTRNYKYGKLCTGTLIVVSPSLIRRSRTYFQRLEDDVEIIIGVNGRVWIGMPRATAEGENAADSTIAELELIYSNIVQEVNDELRSKMARICNCVRALETEFCFISHETIQAAYTISLSEGMPIFDIVQREHRLKLVAQVKQMGHMQSDKEL